MKIKTSILLMFILVFGTGISQVQRCPPSSGTPSGCGVGTLNDQCGNVSPFPAAPSSPTAVTACGALSATTHYQLTADLTASPDSSAACLTLAGANIILDLNGHAISGRITGIGINGNGIHIYSSVAGASITCSNDLSTAACIRVTSTSAFTATAEYDHFTIQNTNSGVTNHSPRALEPDYTPTVAAHNLLLSIHGITCTVPANDSSVTRSLCINTDHSDDVEIYANDLTCSGTAYTCNAIQDIPSDSEASIGGWRIHNNHLNLITQTVGSNTRGITISGAPDADIAHGSGAVVDHNYIITNNNDGVRVRQTRGLSEHDDQFVSVTSATYGAIHDADYSYEDKDVCPNNVYGVNDTFDMHGGVGFWSRGGTCSTFKGATFTGTSGKAVYVRTNPVSVTLASLTHTSGVCVGTPNISDSAPTAIIGYSVGDTVTVAGATTDTGCNGSYVLSAVASDGSNFTYTGLAGSGSPVGGTSSSWSSIVVGCLTGATALTTNSNAEASTLVSDHTGANGGQLTWSGSGTITTASGCP